MSKLKKVLAQIQKKHWAGSAMVYKEMDKIDVSRVSSGLPSLDYILWWGIPEWRVIEVYWPSSSGKTTLAIKFLSEMQKAYPKKRVAFIDVEHALDPKYAKDIGLDMDEIVFCQPQSAEEALQIMEELVDSWEISAIILDSVAKLTPMKEVNGETGQAEMWMRARLMSQGLRKIVPKANKNQCTCIFINQVRSNIWGYWNPEARPWGQALPFDASIIIRTSSKKVDEKTGITKMAIKKNKVGMPFRETEIPITYWLGYDVLQDTITMAKTVWVVTRAWAFYSFQGEKWQWEKAMRAEIMGDPKLLETIKNELAKVDTSWPLEQKKEVATGKMDEVLSELVLENLEE